MPLAWQTASAGGRASLVEWVEAADYVNLVAHRNLAGSRLFLRGEHRPQKEILGGVHQGLLPWGRFNWNGQVGHGRKDLQGAREQRKDTPELGQNTNHRDRGRQADWR